MRQLARLVAEVVALRGEVEDAALAALVPERDDERALAVARIALACDLFPVDDEPAALGAGCLDRALDDHREKRVRIVGRREGLAEAADRLAQAASLGGKLAQPFLELRGHVVEGLAERRELVATADGDTLLELPSRHGAGGGGELAEGADDRAAERVGDDADGGHGGDGEEEEAAAEVAGRGVDLGLGRQGDERDRRAVPALLAHEKIGADRAVADPVDRGVARAIRNVGPATQVAGGDHLSAGDEREAVAFLQRSVLREPLGQLVAEGQVDDDPSEETSVLRDDLHLAHAGVRPGLLTGQELALRPR